MTRLDSEMAILAALLDYGQACAEREPKARAEALTRHTTAVREVLARAYPVADPPWEDLTLEEKPLKVAGPISYKCPTCESQNYGVFPLK